MTDEKQIKEMAKCMCTSYESEKGCKTCPTNWCYADECATMAFCNGYRKIPEDAVVLTKEEHNVLLQEQKRLKEIVDRIPCGYKLKEITRKETVREFVTRVKERIRFLKKLIEPNEIDELAKEYGVSAEE